MKKGKWFFYWKKVQGRICDSDYRFYTKEEEYIYNDKEVHMDEVESWAERVSNVGNYSERGFGFGFDEVECPPKEWLDKKIKSVQVEIKSKQKYLKFISKLA